jgi:lysyl-tRNA synthetase class 2
MAKDRLAAATSRARLYGALRADLHSEAFLEVETPLLVPAPGLEPQITAFEAGFVPEMPGVRARTLYLHTSPEYAMKRLLAEGFQRIYSLCKVFRNGEVARDHNPEFTMLEFYRAHADYAALMDDVERLVLAGARALGVAHATRVTTSGEKRTVALAPGFRRLTVREALQAHAGIDLYAALDAKDPAAALKAEAQRIGVRVSPGALTFDDVFFQVFLERVEPQLGWDVPTFLIDYPRSMASLSRIKPGDGRVAERFELYVAGLELCNGFSELNDAAEQRARLVEEQEQRRSQGRAVYALDEAFLAAVGKLPPSAGVAVGVDRLLMLLTGAEAIADVLLFPAAEFLG